jgi:hypothetical protein
MNEVLNAACSFELSQKFKWNSPSIYYNVKLNSAQTGSVV